MRFSYSSVALFTLISAAVAKNDCVSEHNESLAAFSNCGDRDALIYCMTQLPSDDESDLIGCYTFAGCSEEDAKVEAKFTIKRCRRLSMLNDLKRRADSSTTEEDSSTSTTSTTTAEESTSTSTSTTSSSSSTSTTSSSVDATTTADAATTTTTTATDASATSTDTASTGTASSTSTSGTTSTSTTGILTGTVCFTTGTSSTKSCSTWTNDGDRSTSCFSTYVSTVDCAPSFVCTTNSDSGDDICMQMKGIETGGIVVAIVFASIAFSFFVGVFWASKSSAKKQKIAAEKAEALALKRSATLKKMPTTK